MADYTKPPLSIQQQVDRLKSRGLHFEDEDQAANYLSNISFYRLRAYTYPFQDNDDPNHPFIKRVTFNEIIRLYVIDRKVRLLLFDALEKIEISLRTKIIYNFSADYGSHWHEDVSLYRNPQNFQRDRAKLNDEILRSAEPFIQHYKRAYAYPASPPAWMSLEVASMGLVSKLYSNLKKCPAKQRVATAFGLPTPALLESWLHAFSSVRNLCAHHSRIWNRRLTLIPTLPTHTLYPFLQNRRFHPNKLYGMLCCITYVLAIISPQSAFNAKLKALIKDEPMLELKEMGFPVGWEQEPIWA
jgi:abortive infection bacteriophage resistance protein